MRNRKRIIAWELHIFNNQKTTSSPNVGSSVRKTEAVAVSYQSLQTTIRDETVIPDSNTWRCFHVLATVRVKQTETSSETERKGGGEDRGHVMP